MTHKIGTFHISVSPHRDTLICKIECSGLSISLLSGFEVRWEPGGSLPHLLSSAVLDL